MSTEQPPLNPKHQVQVTYLDKEEEAALIRAARRIDALNIYPDGFRLDGAKRSGEVRFSIYGIGFNNPTFEEGVQVQDILTQEFDTILGHRGSHAV